MVFVSRGILIIQNEEGSKYSNPELINLSHMISFTFFTIGENREDAVIRFLMRDGVTVKWVFTEDKYASKVYLDLINKLKEPVF